VSQIHDFTLAGRYLVIFLSPYGVPYSRLLWATAGFGSLGQAYQWDGSRPTRVRDSAWKSRDYASIRLRLRRIMEACSGGGCACYGPQPGLARSARPTRVRAFHDADDAWMFGEITQEYTIRGTYPH
jgi:hypothetical protein